MPTVFEIPRFQPSDLAGPWKVTTWDPPRRVSFERSEGCAVHVDGVARQVRTEGVLHNTITPFADLRRIVLRGHSTVVMPDGGPHPWALYWCELEIVSAERSIAVSGPKCWGDPETPHRLMLPLAVELAEAMGLPWSWREYASGGIPGSSGSVKAQRSFRRALLLAGIAPGYEYGAFLASSGMFFAVHAVIGGIAISVPFLAAWFLGYPLLLFVARLIRWVCARRVPIEEWDDPLHRSVELLPCLAALGALTWIAYSMRPLGRGWNDVVFGSIGNVLGACWYVPLVARWFRLWRRATAA